MAASGAVSDGTAAPADAQRRHHRRAEGGTRGKPSGSSGTRGTHRGSRAAAASSSSSGSSAAAATARPTPAATTTATPAGGPAARAAHDRHTAADTGRHQRHTGDRRHRHAPDDTDSATEHADGCGEVCPPPPRHHCTARRVCPVPAEAAPGPDYTPPIITFHPPTVTFGLPTPRHVGLPTPPEAPAVESIEPAAEAPPTAVPSEPAAEAPQIVAVAEPAVPAAVEIPRRASAGRGAGQSSRDAHEPRRYGHDGVDGSSRRPDNRRLVVRKSSGITSNTKE